MREFNDLRLLSVFVAVYQNKGISSASRVLNITQPSVTRSIQRLEDELGVPLFDRSSNGIIPTEFATRLFRRALSIIDEIDSIQADAKHLGSEKRRLMNIGTGWGCWIAVSNVLKEINQQEPDLVFNITITNARDMINMIESGSLDFLVGNTLTLNTVPWLESQELIETEKYVIARPGHPVFIYPIENQLEKIQTYPSATYHMLEHSHGTQMSGSAVLRANDYLFLLEHVMSTDTYMAIGKDMLEIIQKFDLKIVGNKSIGSSKYSVAYPQGKETIESRIFIDKLISYGKAIATQS